MNLQSGQFCFHCDTFCVIHNKTCFLSKIVLFFGIIQVYLRHWVKDLDTPMLCVDYSLAPDHPFPRAFQECFYAYAWAVKNCHKLGETHKF